LDPAALTHLRRLVAIAVVAGEGEVLHFAAPERSFHWEKGPAAPSLGPERDLAGPFCGGKKRRSREGALAARGWVAAQVALGGGNLTTSIFNC
jgi:hypothetical protein